MLLWNDCLLNLKQCFLDSHPPPKKTPLKMRGRIGPSSQSLCPMSLQRPFLVWTVAVLNLFLVDQEHESRKCIRIEQFWGKPYFNATCEMRTHMVKTRKTLEMRFHDLYVWVWIVAQDVGCRIEAPFLCVCCFLFVTSGKTEFLFERGYTNLTCLVW